MVLKPYLDNNYQTKLCHDNSQISRTVTKAVIDIGNKEMAAGCTFLDLNHSTHSTNDI